MRLARLTAPVILALTLIAAPLTEAQPAKLARIGFLAPTSASSNPERVNALRAGLRDLDYVEGQNMRERWTRSSVGLQGGPRGIPITRLSATPAQSGPHRLGNYTDLQVVEGKGFEPSASEVR